MDVPYFVSELFLFYEEEIELCRLPFEFFSKLELTEALARREIKKAEKEKFQKLQSIRASTISPVVEQINLENQIDHDCPADEKRNSLIQ